MFVTLTRLQGRNILPERVQQRVRAKAIQLVLRFSNQHEVPLHAKSPIDKEWIEGAFERLYMVP